MVASFLQLRGKNEDFAEWNTSLQELVGNPLTLRRVAVTSFDCNKESLKNFLTVLTREAYPNLCEVVVFADYRHATGITRGFRRAEEPDSAGAGRKKCRTGGLLENPRVAFLNEDPRVVIVFPVVGLPALPMRPQLALQAEPTA
jgi:hypothetical protein